MVDVDLLAYWMHHKSIHINQNLNEFCVWLNRLEAIQPRIMIEVGTYMVGSAQMTLEAVPSIQAYYTIDLVDRNPRRAEIEALYGGRLIFVNADSTKAATWHDLPDADACFIDGDHSYNVCASDYVSCLAKTRSGGLIGFHDVNQSHVEQQPGCYGSLRFFAGLADCYPDKCEYVNGPAGVWGVYGTGIYRV